MAAAEAGAAHVAPAIRAGAPDDVDALAGVSGRAFAATYPGIVPDEVLAEWIETTEQMWRGGFEKSDADPSWRVWVAQRGDDIVGYVTTSAGKDWWLPPLEGSGEVTNLYLEPSAIGSGVGRALFAHAIEDLFQRGFDPLVVWAFRENHRALRFYERMGFAIDVPEHDWVLGGVPCPIVRFRRDRGRHDAPE
jgi:ribosomal protein S18 acetylase RimI-like enzyme